MSEEIQEFLDNQAEGRWDSQGVFSVDLTQAKLKLFRSQLADPAMYILKLVQAAVGSGCHEIQFRESQGGIFEGRAGLEMVWRCQNDEVFPLKKLQGALLSDPLKIDDEALRNLVIGLATALSLGEVGFGFRGQTSWSLLAHPTLKSHITGSGFVLLFDNFFPDRREHALVQQRCLFAPIPIYWNDHLVAKKANPWGPEPRLLERLIGGTGLATYLAHMPRARSLLQLAPLLPPANLYTRQIVDASGCAQILGGPSQGFLPNAATLSIPLSLVGPSRLLAVRHGVTLDPVDLGHLFGCLAVFNGDHLPVDLSGFQARQGAELEDLKLRANQQLVEGAKALLELLPPSQGVTALRNSTESGLRPGRVGWGVIGLVLLLSGNLAGLAALGQAFDPSGKGKIDQAAARENTQLSITRSRLSSLSHIPN